ncbi:aldo/keto reductase [Hydrocarboniphaga sp.]|uniref:aldo/keto reductase n=1 Tax=Hydrocarboniphaga sp. TaxID=2033016 RepID=UPI003D0976BE
MSSASLPQRRLGRTGLRLTVLGFGAAGIGNLYRAIDDETALSAVDAALDLGVRYFDTAPHYGFGLSEKRLGRALSRRDGEVLVSTKVGRVLDPVPAYADLSRPRQGFISPEPVESVFDYSYDGVQRSLEESLRRLGRDRIELLLVHDLGVDTHGAEHTQRFAQFVDGGYRAMREWRDAGLVGAIGMGVNETAVCTQALAHADFDCFLLAGRYTLLEQHALEHFLPLCAARGVSLIIGGPFNSGILASGVRDSPRIAPPPYNYAPAPPAMIERVRRIETLCDEYGVSLPAAALQFPLAHPQVATVIPGAADAAQVRQAAAWLQMPIPFAFWQALREHGLLHPEAPLPIHHGLTA